MRTGFVNLFLPVACFIAILFSGCKTLLDPAAYIKWVENPEHGLRQSQVVNGVAFELQYKPVDYIIARENGKPDLSRSFYEKRKEKLGELYYFSLNLKSGEQDLLMHNINDEQEYYKRVNYYSLDFQQDIKLLCGTDTLACLMYQFENTYGVAPYIRMSIAFSGKKKAELLQKDSFILIEDRVFGGGLLRFPFNSKALDQLPGIKEN